MCSVDDVMAQLSSLPVQPAGTCCGRALSPKPKSRAPAKTQSQSRAASKGTVSGPRKGPRDPSGDRAAHKMVATQELAAAFPFNKAKPAEHGKAAIVRAAADARIG